MFKRNLMYYVISIKTHKYFISLRHKFFKLPLNSNIEVFAFSSLPVTSYVYNKNFLFILNNNCL